MTVRTFNRWVCNMCHHVEETPVEQEPEGWVAYGLVGESKPLGHLCNSCASEIGAPPPDTT